MRFPWTSCHAVTVLHPQMVRDHKKFGKHWLTANLKLSIVGYRLEMNILTLVCCWLQTAKYDDTPSSAAGFEAIVENADKTSEMLISDQHNRNLCLSKTLNGPKYFCPKCAHQSLLSNVERSYIDTYISLWHVNHLQDEREKLASCLQWTVHYQISLWDMQNVVVLQILLQSVNNHSLHYFTAVVFRLGSLSPEVSLTIFKWVVSRYFLCTAL